MTEAVDPFAIVARTGYPLQLAIEAQVRANRNTGWRVLAHEFPVGNAGDESLRFIDLVLGRSWGTDWERTLYVARLVIECKKSRGSLVFLVPKAAERRTPYPRLWCATPHQETDPKTGEKYPDVREFRHFSFGLNGAPVSEFCAPAIDGKLDTRSVERLAADLVGDTLSLCEAEPVNVARTQFDIVQLYVPVIVTTADLKVFSFDPAMVSLETGEPLSPPQSEVTSADVVRFSKNLGFDQPDLEQVAAVRRQPTQDVFVIRARAFEQVLSTIGAFESARPDEWITVRNGAAT